MTDIDNLSQPGSEVLFTPGSSPFMVKGTFWMAIRLYAEERVPGGVEAVGQHLLPAQREFFSQLFIAPGWYDLWPILDVYRALAAANGLSHAEQMQRTAVFHGEKDLNGVYKAMLKQSSPQAVCRRFTGIYSQIYGFGRAEIVREEERRVEACAYGFPEPLAAWWTRATESYLQLILRAAGGKNARMVWLPVRPDGERAGVPLVQLPSHTLWD